MAEEKYKVGDKFNSWTLVEKLPVHKKNSMWKVVCDCGTEKTTSAGNIYSGTSKSCRRCGAKKRWNEGVGVAASTERREARKAKVNEVWSYLINLIESGTVKPGERIPTTMQLVKMFKTNTNVVQDARNRLLKSELVRVVNHRDKENGTYVI